MKRKLFLIGSLAATILSCNNADKSTTVIKDSANVVTDTTKKTIIAQTPVKDSSVQVTAKFVSFSLGDAPHFMFEDSNGKQLEFGNDEDTLTKFALELPEGKANADNQGWASNKALQGKLFNIKYVTKKMVLYEGGPLDDVKVIVAAKPAQ